jgi:hypothetical protein
MNAPAISAVFDALTAAIERIEPAIRPRVRFIAIKDSTDPRDLPSDATAERQFRIRFVGLDPADNGQGTIAPGIADRTARLAIEIAYPVLERDALPDLELASDSEQVQRAMRRGTEFIGTPIRRAPCSTSREDLPSLAIIVHQLSVAYRDQE